MDAIPLCNITKAYTDIYANTQQLLLNTTLFYTWRHVSAAHTSIVSWPENGCMSSRNMSPRVK